jgi:fluoroacetyl-CoA thioesterase
MKETLAPGLKVEHAYRVPPTKTVPHLFPEAAEFQAMPAVLATGYVVGLVEWACIRALEPHLDWPREQTLGTHVSLSHAAPTPPGMTVTVRGTLTKVAGRKLTFEIEASDGVDVVTRGTHERVVVDAERFRGAVAKKAPPA